VRLIPVKVFEKIVKIFSIIFMYQNSIPLAGNDYPGACSVWKVRQIFIGSKISAD
jgi:hypothetical protein